MRQRTAIALNGDHFAQELPGRYRRIFLGHRVAACYQAKLAIHISMAQNAVN